MPKNSSIPVCLFATILVSAAWAKDAPKDSPDPKPLTFQAPKNWKAIDPGQISLARFEIERKNRVASMAVTALAGQAGGLAANINRWRAQIQLDPVTDDEALKAAQPIKVDGALGHAVHLTGPDESILAAAVTLADRTWFFRLKGPNNLVTEEKAAFQQFLKSVRFAK